MTNRLDSLEASLEQLALDFARHVVGELVGTRFSEVGKLLAETEALSAVAFAGEPRERATSAVAPVRRGRRPSREPRVEEPSTRARPEPVLRASDADESDTMANVITDPGLLLGAIAAEPEPPRQLFSPGPVSALLSPGAPAASSSQGDRSEPGESAAKPGPSLRPGEELQRTAGGNVVLRRRGH